MIEEQFVSFDTARMLKEAGFDVVCHSAYYATGNSAVMHEKNSMLSPGCISRPTQALAARWLREVHRIAIDVAFIPPSVDGDVWQYFVGEMDGMIWEGDYKTGRKYATYEQAMEDGLQEAVKLIKK